MRWRLPTWLPVIGVMAFATTPALARAMWFNSGPVSFYYQSPTGQYDSTSDFVRDLRGIPCGIECTRRAEVRWGLIPPPHAYFHRRYYERY